MKKFRTKIAGCNQTDKTKSIFCCKISARCDKFQSSHIKYFLSTYPKSLPENENNYEKGLSYYPSKYFPPTISAVRKIEKELDGIIYDNQHIYISSTKSVEEIAKTLIHEVCHFLNSDLYDKEMETEESKQVGYKDEVRAFTAEKMFEKNKGYLLRSDINQIHETVTELYPKFTDPENPISGYIYSTFDSPS